MSAYVKKVWNYSTVFQNVSRSARPATYCELATWNWLFIVPSRRCDVCTAALMMHHHGDDVYMTSQLCCGLRSVAAKF